MRKLVLALAVAFCSFQSWSQSDCGELLDHDQDGIIGAEDLMNLLSFYGQPLGVDAGPCDNLQSVTFDGYDYDLVAIGEECWFAENLRVEVYRNGDAIPNLQSDVEWQNANYGAWVDYGNNSGQGEVYGKLYNWYAVDDARGLCPSGWHVPTDGEYTELTDFLGGSSIAGTQMKSSPSDDPSWDGTNTSGFSALAGGFRMPYGFFSVEWYDGYFWSSSPDGAGAWSRLLFSGNAGVHRNFNNQRCGFSVRCVRD